MNLEKDKDNINIPSIEDLQISEVRYRRLFEAACDGMLIIDFETGKITDVNPFMIKLLGDRREEIIDKELWEIGLFKDKEANIGAFRELQKTGYLRYENLLLKNKYGEGCHVEIVSNIYPENGHQVIQCNVRDITERKQQELQLRHEAFHDPLTGLANRAFFTEYLQMTIARVKRDRKDLFAVLFLDFDRFKAINDSFGHAEGDNLLKQIARRLESILRSSDLVARIGGDEFTILVDNLSDSSHASLIAKNIQKSLESPFEIAGGRIFISASIGIALSTNSAETAADMLRDADVAMYRAKANGKAQYRVFDQMMHEHALAQIQIETEMRQSIERKEFFLLYQPILNLQTKSLIGFEALVRWKHKTQGIIQPSQFIDAAEDNDLILPLGEWILHESCQQLKSWQKRNPDASRITVSVNLSGKQFLKPYLVENVADTLERTGLDPASLKLEITESHIMENTEMATRTIKNLRALGVDLSIDDFGTGYTSLSYLHRLSGSYLKIDKSFILGMAENDENREMVHTIISLAQNLKLKVIAEGIETSAQLKQLKKLNCTYGQGYIFAKPMEAAMAETFITKSLSSGVYSG